MIYLPSSLRLCIPPYSLPPSMLHHQYLISRFISLPLPVLYLPYLSQYYIFPTSPSTISSLPLPVLYLPYLSQYYIFPTSPSTISSLPLPVLYLPYLSQYYTFPTSPSTISSLPLPVLYLPYLSQYYTFPTSPSTISSLPLPVLYLPYLSQYYIFPTSPSTISSLPPSFPCLSASLKAIQYGKQVGAICTPHVLQRSKDHPNKPLQDGVATAPRHWDRRGQHPPAGQSSSSHNL